MIAAEGPVRLWPAAILAVGVASLVAAAGVLVLRAKLRPKRIAPAYDEVCPDCGAGMVLEDKSSFTGRDMRSYRCTACEREMVVDGGDALWKVLSDAREAAEARKD